jgi:NAD(P)-dependent dehydrogenase (short-subunit alcohol dehydrogenase family)
MRRPLARGFRSEQENPNEIGSGAIGSAVRKALEEKGHQVVSVGRKSGDYQADISHPESLKALFSRIGSFDAVANAAGDVSFGSLEESTDEQWANSITFKGMGQINLVRAALPFIADRGSFTLVSGILTDEYLHGGTIGTTINHFVEGFVKGAAVELPRGLRINCISPTVLAESVAYRLFRRLCSCARLGGRPGLSARDVNADHRSHPQAAQDQLLTRWPRLVHSGMRNRRISKFVRA